MRTPTLFIALLLVLQPGIAGFGSLGAVEPAGHLQIGQRRVEPPDPFENDQKKTMERARNQNRHNELKRDTDRLLELATELKQYVDRTNESLLSVEVVKKAEEIERLAKSVKNKMKGP